MTRLFLIFLITIQPALSQNPTPCDGVFSYQPKGSEDDRWYGEIHFSSPKNLVGVLMHIELDRPADILGNWLGHVTTCNNKMYTIRNPDYAIRLGQYFKLPFFVKYSLSKPIPSLKRIEFNGKTICPEQDTLNSNEIIENNNSETEELPVKPKETSSGKLELSSLDESATYSVNPPKCGVVAPKATSLISKGQETSPGQWPWHAALYHHKDFEIMYACGATLITEQHVLTAAHCVTDGGTKTIMTPNVISISLGKYNLKTFEEDFQDKSITKIFVHPKYNPWRLYNDIAILKLSSPAEVTNFILPCCLWDEEIALENIIGKTGTVVGWGLNADVSHRLMQANMPVVSTSECIFSRAEYREFLNDNNYCAGSRNGTSACRGDSGGAMVFPRQERNGQTVWRVRGIVSLSLVPEAKESCESSNYNIFTDIAKFIPWIQQVINN